MKFEFCKYRYLVGTFGQDRTNLWGIEANVTQCYFFEPFHNLLMIEGKKCGSMFRRTWTTLKISKKEEEKVSLLLMILTVASKFHKVSNLSVFDI